MPKLRVLIVDDSALVRKLLSDALVLDPEIEIAGVAANGSIAVQKLTQCSPDLITLDVEMPEMDGIETVRRIREINPNIPIIMFSALTERGATATLDALRAGANDYVTKPVQSGGVVAAKQMVADEMIPRIRALTGRSAAATLPVPAAPQVRTPSAIAPRPVRLLSSLARPEIVAIGVSTGGPNALAEIFPQFPADFNVPIVIVQHMPPLFTKMLAERLNSQAKIRVHEVSLGMKIEPGHAYLAPGDFHFELTGGSELQAHLHQGPQENSCRPAVDPLFRSVAKRFGRSCLGVILTGMGQDGLRGCEVLHEAGAQILVQDEQSSVVWGMPGYVANANLADAVLPLDQIAPEIIRRVRNGLASNSSARSGAN